MLCDDDVIYDKWVLKNLSDCVNQNNNSVATLIGLKMSDNDGNLIKRESWNLILDCKKNGDLFFYWKRFYFVSP